MSIPEAALTRKDTKPTSAIGFVERDTDAPTSLILATRGQTFNACNKKALTCKTFKFEGVRSSKFCFSLQVCAPILQHRKLTGASLETYTMPKLTLTKPCQEHQR